MKTNCDWLYQKLVTTADEPGIQADCLFDCPRTAFGKLLRRDIPGSPCKLAQRPPFTT
ncbi:MAG: hypothetical protein N3J91_05605 [Verrucomicrobiae bacterium]|nr:hypothetical protein [Verrucomicrobiae bacterium]